MRGSRLASVLDRYAGITLCLLFSAYEVLVSGSAGWKRSAGRRAFTRILIIKLSALGDTILLVPALRALKQCYPDAKISMICTGVNIEAVRGCPYVDDIIVFEPADTVRRPWRFLRFVRDLRGRRFDLSIDADQWLRISAILSYLSGAKVRVGFRTPGQFKHHLCTDSVAHRRHRHEVECFLDLIRGLGATQGFDDTLEFALSGRDREDAQALLSQAGIGRSFVIIHPGVPRHGSQRRWPGRRFAELGCRIRRLGYDIVLTGPEEDGGLLERISSVVRDAEDLPGAVACAVGLPIRQLAAILSLGRLVICNNTGILHLACAVGTPVVGLHGPTDAHKWGPWSAKGVAVKAHLPCSPCLYLGFEYGCTTNRCMQTISVDDVLAAAKPLLT